MYVTGKRLLVLFSRRSTALEYRESLEELQKLQRRMELTLSLHVSSLDFGSIE